MLVVEYGSVMFLAGLAGSVLLTLCGRFNEMSMATTSSRLIVQCSAVSETDQDDDLVLPGIHHAPCQPLKTHKNNVQFQVQTRIRRPQPKATTEHTSPFCVRKERITSGSGSTSTRKCRDIRPQARCTDA